MNCLSKQDYSLVSNTGYAKARLGATTPGRFFTKATHSNVVEKLTKLNINTFEGSIWFL